MFRWQPQRVDTVLLSQPKKEGIDLKTIRHISIRLVLGPEAKPIIFVEVVSPIDATGHPQLTRTLRLSPPR
jgi:hypothetical protein